ncbi:hypothetical protein [Streptomyces sp. NPDC017890]|uniref:hypothetical protein n=1 Tax=Streptomyces sp. NPDC017890 TaxID=3365015 RepID=UPI00378ED5DF
MPADEATRGTDVEASRARTGPRHAAPKKPLFTRLHMPAGKAIALAAMPTAVLMGLGFTPTLAVADGNDPGAPPANSLTAEEYKACVEAMTDPGKGSSASPTPSPSSTGKADGDKADGDKADGDKGATREPSPSASTGDSGSDKGAETGGASSSDSGSDDKAGPVPSATASQEKEPRSEEASPSASESGGGLLEGLGDAIEGIFTGGAKAEESPSPTPSPSASGSAGADASDPAKDATDKVTDTAKGAVEAPADKASGAADGTEAPGDKATGEAKDEAEDEAEGTAGEATASPSPGASESAGADPEDCPVATDEVGGVDNSIPVPDDPWHLEASSLLLKGASYQGIVEVKTASGKTKKVLKYVISKGTDIGDLHQIVKDEQIGRTYHVQAAKGSTSTIRDGDTVMYTESISGNLLGLVPITFDPEHPPPLDIPLIYFTDVKVVQAGQFGGTLHIPGLHQYITD